MYLGEPHIRKLRPAGILVAVLLGLFLFAPGAVASSYVPTETYSSLGPDDEFASPIGLTVDEGGSTYVVDHELDAVLVLDESGALKYGFGGAGSGEGQFSGPTGVALAPDGSIWVADAGNNRIQHFENDGDFISATSVRFGGSPLASPVGIATTAAGQVLVSEAAGNRIQRYDSAGDPVGSFGSAGSGNGQFSLPLDVAVDNSGNIHVVDSLNNRIQKFDAAGNFISSIGTPGTGPVEFDAPLSIDFDSAGNSLIADTSNERIQQISPSGSLIRQFQGTFAAGGNAPAPSGIAVGPRDSVFVSFSGDHLVQKFVLRRELTVTKAGAGSGTIKLGDANVGCTGATCATSADNGDTVTVTAVAAGGSTFAGWAGACSGTGPCQVTLNDDIALTATFTKDRRLTIAKNGTGSGTVSSGPVGIFCGTACGVTLPEGGIVSLQAKAAAGSVFKGWSGASCPGTGGCTVGLNTDKTVNATFDLLPSVKKAPKAKITGKPGKKTKARKATFKFKSDISGSTYLCRIDRKKFAACKSPKTFKGLKPGKHTFQVKAKAAGLTGAVAAYAWTIKKK